MKDFERNAAYIVAIDKTSEQLMRELIMALIGKKESVFTKIKHIESELPELMKLSNYKNT